VSQTQLRLTILLVGFVVVVLDQAFLGERVAVGLTASERMLALCIVAVGVSFTFRLFRLNRRFRRRVMAPPPVPATAVAVGRHDSGATPSNRSQWLLTILGIIAGGLLIIVVSSSISDQILRGTVLQAMLTLWLAGLSGRFAWLVSGSWPMSRRALMQIASVVAVSAFWAGVVLHIPSTTDAAIRTYSSAAAWFTSGFVAVATIGTIGARYLLNRSRQ